MCKELCGQVYEDYKAGRIGYKQFAKHHREQVLAAMRNAAPGTSVVFLDYRDGTASVIVVDAKKDGEKE